MLPVETNNLKKATLFQLVYQGLYLHFASLWGPLRTSSQTRVTNPDWFVQAVWRWVQEYGLNLTLFFIGQITILYYFSHHYIIATTFLIILLPFLTVVQMFVDNLRTDSQVYFDPHTKTGLTVKTYVNENGTTVWTFYNHYALPIGAKNGKPIRQQLHQQASAQNIILTCHAQNTIIADYYVKENPTAFIQDTKRPHLIWDYSGKGWVERETSLFAQVFGIHSSRNSGQIPLQFAA